VTTHRLYAYARCGEREWEVRFLCDANAERRQLCAEDTQVCECLGGIPDVRWTDLEDADLSATELEAIAAEVAAAISLEIATDEAAREAAWERAKERP
jgi:hypothetical protein